jgi:hypothetical protein
MVGWLVVFNFKNGLLCQHFDKLLKEEVRVKQWSISRKSGDRNMAIVGGKRNREREKITNGVR